MTAARLRAERSGAVLRLTLNDDATRNSLSEEMMASLQSALDSAALDPAVGVIIISSTGKVFSFAGPQPQTVDCPAASTLTKAKPILHQSSAPAPWLMTTVAHHRCAIIAEVDGLASAAGCQLVATCDLAYCSPHASSCTPGVSIGLFCSTPMVALSRNLSAKHSMEMLLTGRCGQRRFRRPRWACERHRSTKRTHGPRHSSRRKNRLQVAGRHHLRQTRFSRTTHAAVGRRLCSAPMTRNMLDGAACEGLDAFINKRTQLAEAMTTTPGPRINFITLGVKNIANSRTFYERLVSRPTPRATRM